MADAIAGHEGRVMISGAVFICEKWTVRNSATKVPANDFESRYRKNKAGLVGAEVSCSGYFDRDNNPHASSGSNIRAGQTLTNVQAFLVKGGFVFTFSEITIFDVEDGDEVDGRVDLTWSGDTNGAWTYPGSVAAV